MNKTVMAALAALVLAACQPAAESPAPAQAVGASAVAAPSQAPQLSVLSAAEAQQLTFEFSAATEQSRVYFNAAGEPTEQASAGGFYRDIIGKTADGRLVAQDFYQDIGKPQTAPFVLVSGADIKDFSDQAMDSRGVWYRPDGSLYQVQDYRAGKAMGVTTFYENDLPVLQLSEEQRKGSYFYADGRLMAEVQAIGHDPATVKSDLTLFRADGSRILRMVIQGENIQEVQAWDAQGQSVQPKDVQTESMPLLDKLQQIDGATAGTQSFVMGTAAASAAQ